MGRVKRLSRWAFNLLAGFVLLLCTALGVMLMRSCVSVEYGGVPGVRMLRFELNAGRMYLRWTRRIPKVFVPSPSYQPGRCSMWCTRHCAATKFTLTLVLSRGTRERGADRLNAERIVA
jgi:hypothetical protein